MTTDAQMEAQTQLLIESNKETYEKIEMGMEVQAFLKSKVGRILVRRADDERDDAIKELCNCDPSDQVRVRDLQSTIKRAESIQFWMAEVIQEGISSEEQLRAQDRNHHDDNE